MKLGDYKSFVFDCDGVLLNSNAIKTEAFYEAALPFGETYATALVDYHVANGGISRFAKFKYFAETIVPPHLEPNHAELVDAYAKIVFDKLLDAEVAPKLEELREATSFATWFIVSGGFQSELRAVFKAKGLDQLFDGGIFGSPDDKIEIMSREIGAGRMEKPGLFLGDSKYDYRSSTQNGLDFIFVSGWTEVGDWNEFCKDENIKSIETIADLLALS